jgi:hypothetical protein
MSGNRKVKSPLLTGRTLLAGILLMLVLLATIISLAFFGMPERASKSGDNADD